MQADSKHVGTRFPLRACDRLPKSVIRAIYVEQLRIWNFEGPWIEGIDETKTYEMAIENLRRERDDVPESILFWVGEVKCEFMRLIEESGKGGNIRYLDSQREQVLALATSNVEWQYFNQDLKMESQRGEFHETKLDVAEDPKVWILEMLGGDARQYQTISSANTYDERSEPVQSEVADRKTNGKPKFPADSKWRSKLRHVLDVNNPEGQTGPYLAPSFPTRQLVSSPISPLAHCFSTDDILQEPSDEKATVATPCADVSEEAFLATDANTLTIAAPVTPALLLRLPNREDAMIEDLEDFEAPIFISFQTVNYYPAEENGIDRSPTSTEISPRSLGATSRSDTATEPTDHEDSDAPITDEFSFTSKLRPHRFFTVESPDVTTCYLSLFGPQKAFQAALDIVVQDLPEVSSDEDEDNIETPRTYSRSLVV